MDLFVSHSMLLEAGFDINHCSVEGTSLHEAVAQGHAEAAILLLNVCTLQWTYA